MSVIVTGLFDEVKDCCATAGLTPHTQALSLGIWGKTERLPDRKYLDIHPMCGHAMVPLALIDSMIRRVRAKRLPVEQAAVELTKPCVCGVFNPTRAAELLRRFLSTSPPEVHPARPSPREALAGPLPAPPGRPGRPGRAQVKGNVQ